MLIETLIQVHGPLFEAVQSSSIFKDDKTFVDAVPKKDPEKILLSFEELKEKENFDLKEFILKHFYIPEGKEKEFPLQPDVSSYIDEMWGFLAKDLSQKDHFSTLIPTPYPHVVPGGRFREAYYWDSYFTIEGLVLSNRFDLIENIAKNFAYLIDHFGFIPNGNRFYYLTRSQQPYFSVIVDLLYREGYEELALSFYPQLVREYRFWMKGDKLLTEEKNTHARVVLLKEGYVLNRYYDELNHPREESYSKDVECFKQAKEENKEELYRNLRAACESGWDFTSRFMKDPKDLSSISTLDYIPVDLNCLLYHHELLLAKFADLLNETDQIKEFSDAAEKRKTAILDLFWDGNEHFFFDYNHKENKCSKVFSLASVFPLFFEICSPQEAKHVHDILQSKFLKAGGLMTTLTESGQQWDGNNAWAPLQLLAYMGLKNYGFDELAKEIAKRFSLTCQKVFAQEKTLLEKYNAETMSSDIQDGEYELQKGFGWTNATLKVFLDELKN